MNFKNVNWLAVIVTLAVCMGIGFLWYGFLFMDLWMVGNGITMNEAGDMMIKDGVETPSSGKPMVVNAVAMVLYALFMHWVLEKSNGFTLVNGLKTGFIFGLVIYMGVATNNMFAQTSYSLTQIDGSYAVVLWTAIGTVMGAWPKKNKA